MIYRGSVSIYLTEGNTLDVVADKAGHFSQSNISELQAHLEYLSAKHNAPLRYLKREGWNASVMELRCTLKGKQAFPYLALVSPDRAASPCKITRFTPAKRESL